MLPKAKATNIRVKTVVFFVCPAKRGFELSIYDRRLR